MSTNNDILISLDHRHASNIYSGAKQVELRRRKMNVRPGTTVWFYEKLPAGSITGYATVKAVYEAPPIQLWRCFSSVSGLCRDEFFNYFGNVSNGCALELEQVSQLQNPVSLMQLRRVAGTFQPPQFFIRLSAMHPVLLALKCGAKQHFNGSERSPDTDVQERLVA